VKIAGIVENPEVYNIFRAGQLALEAKHVWIMKQARKKWWKLK